MIREGDEAMDDAASRRSALKLLGAGLGLAAAPAAAVAATPAAAQGGGFASLGDLGLKLAALPRRRNVTTTTAVLSDPSQWDAEALAAVLAYGGGPKQVWSASALGWPWLTAMRNALDVQVYSYRHPDFLVASLTRGPALMALLDQPAWDKYGLAGLDAEAPNSNVFLQPRPPEAGDPAPIRDPRGPFSADDASIPALQARGAVFLACHVALWGLAGVLGSSGRDPDKAGQAKLAAALTDHLVPGVVLTPGATGTLPAFADAGFHLAV